MSGTVKGSIVDPDGNIMANCQLFMYRRTDGALLGSAVSDENGDYELTHTAENSEKVFMVCLDNDDSPDFEGLIRDRIAIAAAAAVISCDGALAWLDIYIANQSVPANFIVTFILNGGDYVDALIRFENETSTFYDADGNDITDSIGNVLGIGAWDHTDNPVSSEFDGVIELWINSDLIEYRITNFTVLDSEVEYEIYQPNNWTPNPTVTKNEDGSFNGCLYFDTSDDTTQDYTMTIVATGTGQLTLTGITQWTNTETSEVNTISDTTSETSVTVPIGIPIDLVVSSSAYIVLVSGEGLYSITNYPVASLSSGFFSHTNAVNLVEVPSTGPVLSSNSYSNLFSGCTALVGSNIGTWDVSSIVNFEAIFFKCTAFNGDISAWNTSSGTAFNAMFYDATAFNQDISNWNTANVTNMFSMFHGASSFVQDISPWNVLQITDKPDDFDESTSADWTDEMKPQWGTSGSA